MPKLSRKDINNQFLQKVSKYYKINKNQSLEVSIQAFNHFLCLEELEKFVIPILEYNINKRYVTTKIKNKYLNS